MAMMLSICGFQTDTAYNGTLALEKARRFHPEFVLLDLGLPDIDGYEVAAALREDCDLKQAVVIAISAREVDPGLLQKRKARFDQALVKPVELEVLLRLLRRCERSSHSEGE